MTPTTPSQSRDHSSAHADTLDALASALPGRFLVFEGPDGSGKTTQLTTLRRELTARGITIEHVREPGGTPAGERIRHLLLDHETGDLAPACETMLYMASRAQLCAHVIRPALEARKLVIADRFVSSTIAYQGAGGGMSEQDIHTLGDIATAGANPDLVLIYDVDARTAASRLSPLLDRMEAKGADFHARVRASYQRQADAEPDRHAVINAMRDPHTVFAETLRVLAERFPGTEA